MPLILSNVTAHHQQQNSFSVRTQSPLPGTTTSAGGASSSQRTLELNAVVIDDILTATRAMHDAVVEGLPD